MMASLGGRRRDAIVFTVLFASFFAVYAAALVHSAYVGKPPLPGDGPDYDNIAMQLARGRGFATDFTDSQWRRPYVENNARGIYDELLARRAGYTTTTYRPPLLPLAISAVYRIAGRNFLVWQLINCAIVACALSIAYAAVWVAIGWRAAVVAGLLGLASATYFDYTSTYTMLSEPLAMLFMSLLFASMTRLRAHPRNAALNAGAAVAGLGLSRNVYVPLTLLVPLLCGWLVWRARANARQAIGVALLIFGIGAGLQTPWWIRNCLVLGRFMPFGTQAGLNMNAAFSGDAVLHRGVWWSGANACNGCDEAEVAAARLARLFAHPGAALQLGVTKIAETCAGGTREAGPVTVFYLLALLSPIAIWRRRRIIDTSPPIAALVLIAASLFLIAMTWSVGWRFLVPVEPLLACSAAMVITLPFDSRGTP